MENKTNSSNLKNDNTDKPIKRLKVIVDEDCQDKQESVEENQVPREETVAEIERERSNANAVYVKLPIYIGQFIRDVFPCSAKGFIILPRLTELRSCFKHYLVENVNIQRIPYKTDRGFYRDNSSYCEAAYKMLPFEDMKIPKSKELPYLFPFEMPPYIWVNRGMVKTNDHYELSYHGAPEFRAMCDEFFFTELRKYIFEQKSLNDKLQRKESLNQMIEYFCRSHKIDNSNILNLTRAYYSKTKHVPKNCR